MYFTTKRLWHILAPKPNAIRAAQKDASASHDHEQQHGNVTLSAAQLCIQREDRTSIMKALIAMDPGHVLAGVTAERGHMSMSELSKIVNGIEDTRARGLFADLLVTKNA